MNFVEPNPTAQQRLAKQKQKYRVRGIKTTGQEMTAHESITTKQ